MSIVITDKKIRALLVAAVLWDQDQEDFGPHSFESLDEVRLKLGLEMIDTSIPSMEDADVLAMINEVLQAYYWKEVTHVR